MQGLQAALDLYFQDGVDVAMRAPPHAEPRGEGGRARRWASICSARASTTTGPSPRSAHPEAADADTISDTMRSDFGCVIAPGQGPLKGKVFRIGHFGYFSELDIIRGLAALEMTLEHARASR